MTTNTQAQCPTCQGFGELPRLNGMIDGEGMMEPCPTCHGTGKLPATTQLQDTQHDKELERTKLGTRQTRPAPQEADTKKAANSSFSGSPQKLTEVNKASIPPASQEPAGELDDVERRLTELIGYKTNPSVVLRFRALLVAEYKRGKTTGAVVALDELKRDVMAVASKYDDETNTIWLGNINRIRAAALALPTGNAGKTEEME